MPDKIMSGITTIVTGGNGLLGSEYVLALASAGATVVILDIAEGPSKKINDLILSGLPIFFYSVDITQEDKVISMFSRIVNEIGIPTVLINNAGFAASPNTSSSLNGPFETYTFSAWQNELKVHLDGTFLVSREFFRYYQKTNQRKGSIINIGSIYGLVAPDQSLYEYKRKKGEQYYKPASYSTAKGGLVMFTKWLAEYCGLMGLRVNMLVPGAVPSSNEDPAFISEYEKRVISGRVSKPSDYSGAILFLASNASSYMTGAIMVVDGGWTVR